MAWLLAIEGYETSQLPVVVPDGGNSAGQPAMYLATYARRVFIVIRGVDLVARISACLIEQLRTPPNIELLPHSQVQGSARPGPPRCCDSGRERHRRKVPHPHPARVHRGPAPHRLDSRPNGLRREWLPASGSRLVADQRYAEIRKKGREPYPLETCAPGTFAADNSRAGAMSRVTSAVGEGSMAIKFAHKYLTE